MVRASWLSKLQRKRDLVKTSVVVVQIWRNGSKQWGWFSDAVRGALLLFFLISRSDGVRGGEVRRPEGFSGGREEG